MRNFWDQKNLITSGGFGSGCPSLRQSRISGEGGEDSHGKEGGRGFKCGEGGTGIRGEAYICGERIGGIEGMMGVHRKFSSNFKTQNLISIH